MIWDRRESVILLYKRASSAKSRSAQAFTSGTDGYPLSGVVERAERIHVRKVWIG